MAHPSGRNLKGLVLRGADLHGADLHDADLRGTDLSGADLREADLRGARTGLTPSTAALQAGAATAVALLGGFTSSWTGERIRLALQSGEVGAQIDGLLLTAELLICLLAMAWRGPWFSLRFVLTPTTALLLLASLGGIFVRHSLGGLVVVGVVVLIAVTCAAELLARALARTIHKLAVVAVLAAWLVGARLASGQGAAIIVAVTTGIAGMRVAADANGSPVLTRWVRRLATLGGTCLRTADLRDAKLSGARLRCCDLRGARVGEAELHAALEVRFCRFDEGRERPSAAAGSG